MIMMLNVFAEFSNQGHSDLIFFTPHKHYDVVTQYLLRHLAGLFVATSVKVKTPVGGRWGSYCLQSDGNNLNSVISPAADLNLAGIM